MLEIHDVKIEFLRHGPAHNQLLSPLTVYLALCGADSPASVTVPFEHMQLLNRLNRLRYEVNGVDIEASQRLSELRELGGEIARMLGAIPAIDCSLRQVRTSPNRLLNLRLVVSANELSLLPFEATMSPDQTGSSGAPLLINGMTTLTREIRRGQPLPVLWNRRPRILFAFASPEGQAPVPAQAHLEALRRAIDPWVKQRGTPEEQVNEVARHLTVLPQASIKEIRRLCLEHEFTHVHILAHGAPLPHAQDLRYGVVLASDDDPGTCTVVDGASLAYVLKGVRANEQTVPPPTVVTLSTCDSGNAGSVIAPGGSIAHELHANDVPWVIASQFPLWMDASVKATEVIYSGLLQGRDPRMVMYEVRQRLRVDHPETHDWASLVAYATLPVNFDAQVRQFRSRQTKRRMNVQFDRMDDLILWKARQGQADATVAIASNAPASEAEARAEIMALVRAIRSELKAWACDPAVQGDVPELVSRMGMQAAAEKRIAIAWSRYQATGTEAEINQAYDQARRLYRKAMLQLPSSHWMGTQFISLSAVCARRKQQSHPLGWQASLRGLRHWWHLSHDLAQAQVSDRDPDVRAWAHANLAELALLSALFVPALMEDGVALDAADQARDMVEHCQSLLELSGEDSFPVKTTARQIERYTSIWADLGLAAPAQAALTALSDQS